MGQSPWSRTVRKNVLFVIANGDDHINPLCRVDNYNASGARDLSRSFSCFFDLDGRDSVFPGKLLVAHRRSHRLCRYPGRDRIGHALCPRCRQQDGDAGLLILPPHVVLGERQFTDGAVRTVYQETDGRQFVLDDVGDKVFGVWIASEEANSDSCLIVPSHS